ncbi:MAG: hypothetical protein E6I70_01960 [Chloroflexi bacterium]|nr:MAG: hypothetical protein E6I70_01960 [Chloroflexota bacterium]
MATFSRLARQRMRWAEGHTYNVRRWFGEIMRSPRLGVVEKLEFLYYATYYLQAVPLAVGSLSWLVAEIIFHAHVPEWTATLGWSLLFSNLLCLPLMNLSGLLLEDAPPKDFVGVLGALVTSYLLVPFQAWAALKGFFEKEEGPWYRTPKTGRVTDPIKHLRRLKWLRKWLFGNGHSHQRRPASQPVHTVGEAPLRRPSRRLGWIVTGALVLASLGVGVAALHAPVAYASSGSQFWLYAGGAGPTFFTASSPAAANPTLQGTFNSPCIPACPFVWTASNDGVSASATTNAQTVFAGTYTFDYWTTNTGFNAVISWKFEYGDNAGCSVGTVVIAQNNNFPLLNNHTGGTPVSVGTTVANTAVPAGKFFCLAANYVSGGPTTVQLNSQSRPTNFHTPSVIFIPEYGLALAGFALVAPIWRRVRRWEAQ